MSDATGLFEHVVFTRFNLDTPGREENYRRASNWLEKRIALFEQFCLPSMTGQTCQNFTWHVLFSDRTPIWARKEIEKFQAQCQFAAHFVPLFGPEGWGNIAISSIERPCKLLITTNLDSDDALACDFIERVQAVVATQPLTTPYAINFLNGYVRNSSFLFNHTHRSNAFSTLVEESHLPLKTTCGIRHMTISRYVKVFQETGAPAWLQVVHGENVSNVVRGSRAEKFDEARFPSCAGAGLNFERNIAFEFDRKIVSKIRRLRDLLLIAIRRVFPARS